MDIKFVRTEKMLSYSAVRSFCAGKFYYVNQPTIILLRRLHHLCLCFTVVMILTSRANQSDHLVSFVSVILFPDNPTEFYRINNFLVS